MWGALRRRVADRAAGHVQHVNKLLQSQSALTARERCKLWAPQSWSTLRWLPEWEIVSPDPLFENRVNQLKWRECIQERPLPSPPQPNYPQQRKTPRAERECVWHVFSPETSRNLCRIRPILLGCSPQLVSAGTALRRELRQPPNWAGSDEPTVRARPLLGGGQRTCTGWEACNTYSTTESTNTCMWAAGDVSHFPPLPANLRPDRCISSLIGSRNPSSLSIASAWR